MLAFMLVPERSNLVESNLMKENSIVRIDHVVIEYVSHYYQM
jgi:hypothetical protein